MNKVLEDLHVYIELARDEQNQSDNSSVRVRDKCIVDLASEVERLEAEHDALMVFYDDLQEALQELRARRGVTP